MGGKAETNTENEGRRRVLHGDRRPEADDVRRPVWLIALLPQDAPHVQQRRDGREITCRPHQKRRAKALFWREVERLCALQIEKPVPLAAINENAQDPRIRWEIGGRLRGWGRRPCNYLTTIIKSLD